GDSRTDRFEFPVPLPRLAKDGGVVSRAQPAIGAEDEKDGVILTLAPLHERVPDFARGSAQVGRKLADLAGERLRLRRPVHRLLKARRGDQLHRPRDLADVADRLAALDEFAGVGHASNPKLTTDEHRRTQIKYLSCFYPCSSVFICG